MQVKDLYKLPDAQQPVAQIKVANDLADLADKATKPEEQFVLLRLAAETACEAGDTSLMFQFVDRLGKQFELDPLTVKEKLLAKLAAEAKDTARIGSLMKGYSALIDQALADDRFDMAQELANAANSPVPETRGRRFASRGSPCARKSKSGNKRRRKWTWPWRRSKPIPKMPKPT